jgi:hypothetical protein
MVRILASIIAEISSGVNIFSPRLVFTLITGVLYFSITENGRFLMSS